jgi:hypothetical protein
MYIVPKSLAEESVSAQQKGWFRAFTDYTPCDTRVLIPLCEFEAMERMVKQWSPRRIETGGYCLIGMDHPVNPTTIAVTRVFEYAGDTQRSVVTLVPDGAEMETRFTRETGQPALCDRVAPWHSHPDHFGRPCLSIDDVMGVRESYNVDDGDYWVMQLLMFIDTRNNICELGAFCNHARDRLAVSSSDHHRPNPRSRNDPRPHQVAVQL